MFSIKLLSPAKLNLYLKVVGRRPDGYHELVTIFHRISLCDTLTLRKQKSGFRLTCSNPKLSCKEDNLITRAYRELQKEIPDLGGVSVRLAKKIPMGGGLGGGSGNAGVFLVAMNRLYGLKIPLKRLTRIGARLGADVAFFVQDAVQAVGTGVGETLQKIPSKTRHSFVLALSSKGLNTKLVYQTFSKSQGRFSATPGTIKSYARTVPQGARQLTFAKRVARLLLSSLAKKNYDKVAALTVNDLEIPALRLRPEIGKTMQRLGKSGLTAVRMSGSGPTVFGIARNEKEARSLASQLHKIDRSRKYIVCHTV